LIKNLPGPPPAERTAICAPSFSASRPAAGAKNAILAVANSMLTAAYHMLRDGVEYHNLDSQHFTHRGKDQVANRLIQRLRDLDVVVEVKAA